MVANKANNERIDADILQCKADIRRARDIMPPSKKKPQEEFKSKEPSENATPSIEASETSTEEERASLKYTEESLAEQVKPGKSEPAESVSSSRQETKIPRFDLAEEIMAEQRKITAIRRKAPGKRIEVGEQKVRSIDYAAEQPTPVSPEQGRIIAEIVARDIEKLCRGSHLTEDRERMAKDR
jgi:hypothetical protein